jgi:hypothetical protein
MIFGRYFIREIDLNILPMKKHLLTFIIVLSGWCVMAQTNTFPTTGNAGIGTTAPGANLVIQAATPELRFITSADSTSFARFLRSTASSNNLFQGKNHVLQVGSGSDAIRFTNTTQSFSSNDAGMPSGTSITMTFSCVYRGNSLYTFLKWGNSTQYITIFNVGATFYVYYGGTRIFFGIIPSDNSNWHNLVFVMNGSSGSLYVDNILNKTMSFEAAYNVVSGGAGSLSNNDGASFPIDIDQVLIYNRALSRTSGLGSSDEIAQINSSGAYTASPPTSGLIRRYEFEEGSGSTVADLNPNTTPYNLALNNSPTWLVNGGIVPVGGSASESTFFSVSDGVTNAERGVATWGDFNGRNQQQGKWFQWKQGSNYPLVSNNAGHWLFDPNRTVDTLANVASTIDVAGNLTIGSAYAGVNAAPANGLLVQGSVGIGVTNPTGKLEVISGSGVGPLSAIGPNGSILVDNVGSGQSYYQANTFHQFQGSGGTPILTMFDGGNVGIGTIDPKGYKLAINGNMIATSVKVKAYANWPDYVFNKEHPLMPLSDLKAYVDKNQHLPEIPSAAEIEKNGQDLGEMNKLLVKKMEEMTLYMIEKDKQIRDQEQRLKSLEQRIEQMAKKD